MNRTAHAYAADALSVKRVGTRTTILRLRESLEGAAVSILYDAFDDALEHGATDVVVDLGTPSAVSVEGAATLTAMAASMRGGNRTLWIAAGWSDGSGYTLRPIRESGPTALTGVSPALDHALASLASALGDDPDEAGTWSAATKAERAFPERPRLRA